MSRVPAIAGSHSAAHGHYAEPLSVYVVDLDTASEALEAVEQSTPRLSPDQIARFEQSRLVRGLDDARRWRVAHIALRIALERATSPEVRGVPYQIEPGGRPRLSRELKLPLYPQFSLAHASAVALIAISNIGPVGVDVEVSRHVQMSAARRQRMVQAAERLASDAALPDEPGAQLLQSWVRLEAVAKATGLGIGRILTEAGIVGGPPDSDRATPERGVAVRDLDVGADRFGAISAAKLPQILVVQAFPADAAALAQFAG